MRRLTFTPSVVEYEITVDIGSGIVTGEFPTRALKWVMEWHELNHDALAVNRELARERRALRKIAPLE